MRLLVAIEGTEGNNSRKLAIGGPYLQPLRRLRKSPPLPSPQGMSMKKRVAGLSYPEVASSLHDA